MKYISLFSMGVAILAMLCLPLQSRADDEDYAKAAINSASNATTSATEKYDTAVDAKTLLDIRYADVQKSYAAHKGKMSKEDQATVEADIAKSASYNATEAACLASALAYGEDAYTQLDLAQESFDVGAYVDAIAYALSSYGNASTSFDYSSEALTAAAANSIALADAEFVLSKYPCSRCP